LYDFYNLLIGIKLFANQALNPAQCSLRTEYSLLACLNRRFVLRQNFFRFFLSELIHSVDFKHCSCRITTSTIFLCKIIIFICFAIENLLITLYTMILNKDFITYVLQIVLFVPVYVIRINYPRIQN
jgi:hypothetical protein